MATDLKAPIAHFGDWFKAPASEAVTWQKECEERRAHTTVYLACGFCGQPFTTESLLRPAARGPSGPARVIRVSLTRA
jgi:hypothetical protein